MIDIIKQKIAKVFVRWQLKDQIYNTRSFTDFFKKSFSFLVLMPENESDFHHSFIALKGLDEERKKATIFTYDYRVSLIPLKYRPQVIEHGISDINNIDLPSQKLISKLKDYNFQVVLDLNRDENIFYSYISNLIDVPIRVGFKKNNSDKFYNFQIVNSENNSELSYENFLNCLKMF